MGAWTRVGVVGTVLVGVLAAGCGPGDAPGPAMTSLPPVTVAPPTSSPSVEPPPAPPAVDVRTGGAALTGSDASVVGALLTAPGAAPVTGDRPDGTTATTLTGPAGALAWVAPPDGGTAQPLEDGSATVQDAAGTVVAALGAPVAGDGTRAAWRAEGDVLVVGSATGSASFVVGTVALASATWGEAEGGRSLAVVPADWVRTGGLAAQQALASQLAASEPEAATASMQAQLWCHVLGARDKASWNLEPWRPDVPTSTMLLTRCNPDDDDL